MQREDGTITTTPEEIELEVLTFYKKLVGLASRDLKGFDIVAMRDGKQITSEQGRKLVPKVTNQEIFDALKSLGITRLLG